MKLIKATESYNKELIEFFKETTLPGLVGLSFFREDDFFDQYKLISEDFVTYTLVDEKNQIHTTATILFFECMLEGKKQVIGYATDLRVSRSRRAIKEWANHFLPILIDEREKRNCKYIISSIGSKRNQAQNALIRPRSTRRNLPRYHLFRKYQLVNIHGRFPFSPKPLSSLDLRFATKYDVEDIQQYIAKKQMRRPLSLPAISEDLLSYIKNWKGLSIESFLLAMDDNNEIVGLMAIWKKDLIQKIFPMTKSKRVKSFQGTLFFLSLLGRARKLPKKDQHFNMTLISHLYVDNPDVFYTLLNKVYKSGDRKSFLSYINFEGDLNTLPPRSYITSHLHYGLYCILSPKDPIPDFLLPHSLREPPDFDPAYI